MMRKVKIGFTVTLILLIISLYFYDNSRTNDRIAKSEYTKGISSGVIKNSKGSLLEYTFKVGDSIYYGNVSDSFCNQCQNCCTKGDTVVVRYEKGNPINSDLVVSFPSMH